MGRHDTSDNVVRVYGEIVRGNNTLPVVSADGVKDYDKNKTQDVINAEVDTALSGKYQKPVDGIPKSDLAEGVQESLNNADSALQSQEQADWNESDSTKASFIKNKPAAPAAQMNADWNASSGVAEILNKPTTIAGYGITDGYTKTEGQALESEVDGRLDAQDAAIALLNGSEVIVVADHTAVTTPDTQKIYREPEAVVAPAVPSYYIDWMYKNGTWEEIAKYDFPGIDDVPTTESDNLVKSGGVREALDELGYYIEGFEWVRVITDKDEKILAGIKEDGSVEWAKGVPTPIQEALKKVNISQSDQIADNIITTSKIADASITGAKIGEQLSYELGIGKEATASFASGQSYPWYYIFSGIDIKIGDAIEWSVETADNSDNYWMATRDANNNTVQNTSIDKGSRSGIFVATVAADKFALGIRQGSSYTGNYKIKARKVEPEIADLENRVEALEQGSPSGTGILDLNPEKEILPILKDFRHRIRNGAFVEQTKQLVLLQLTDQHGDETRMNRAMQFASQYGAYIDDVIHTGDLVYDNWADGVDWFANIQNKNNILQVIGNHDVVVKAGSDGKVYTNPNDLSQYIETSGYVPLNKTTYSILGYKNSDNEMVWVNYTDIYGRYIAPYVSNWGVTQPSNAVTEGLNYYYKDYAEQGIRLIALDCMMYDNAQNTWLVNVLADAKTNSYGVIIAEHYPIQLDGFEYCAFTSSGMKDVTDFYQSEGDAATLADAQLAVDNFMNTGGEFICWLAGHTHKDCCGTLKNYPKQVMIVSNITGLNHPAWGEDVRTVGTKTEDCFSVIAVDRYKKIVRLYRVGNQWDRYGRHKVSMAFDYRAAKMIYSS